MVREQTGWMLDLLGDPAVTGAVIVASPEEMPVNETLELSARIESETNVELAAVIVNRVLPELFGRGEEAVFDRLREPAAAAALTEAVGSPIDRVLDAADLAVTLRRTRVEHLNRLREGLTSGVDLLYVPELFTKHHGIRATRQVAEALGAELGY
jgi:anion-transporting  ArsA/GET3 family ATPase